MAKKRYTRAQQLRDPAKRARLPMSALTPAQQAQRRIRLRREQVDRDPLYNPARQLGGMDLSRAADQVTDLQFRPAEQALVRAGEQATAQGTALVGRAGDYYRQLAEREANAVAMQRAIGDQLQAALRGNAEQAGQAIGTAEGAERARVQQDAQLRGADLSGGPSGALEELARMRAAAAQSSQTAQNAGAATSANYQGLAGLAAQARGLAGGELQQQLLTRLANQQAEVRAKQSDLGVQRGDARVKNLLDLRQSGFENLVTARGLDIKQSELEADVAQARSDTALKREQLAETRRNNAAARAVQRRGQDITAETTRRGQDVTRRGQDLTRQSALDRIAAQGGKPRKNEPAASVKYRQNIGAGRGRWRELMRRYDDEARVKRIMIEKDKVPPEAYNAIYDLERTGRLHPANVKALEALGVVVPGQWRRRSRAGGSNSRGGRGPQGLPG